MKITYDKFANAAYIYISSKKKSKRTIAVTDEIIVDLDDKGGLMGVEVLEATKHLSKDILKGAIQLKSPSFS
jgi:uncharacterized protein YuzE